MVIRECMFVCECVFVCAGRGDRKRHRQLGFVQSLAQRPLGMRVHSLTHTHTHTPHNTPDMPNGVGGEREREESWMC